MQLTHAAHGGGDDGASRHHAANDVGAVRDRAPDGIEALLHPIAEVHLRCLPGDGDVVGYPQRRRVDPTDGPANDAIQLLIVESPVAYIVPLGVRLRLVHAVG
jgi:hypothetical protein